MKQLLYIIFMGMLVSCGGKKTFTDQEVQAFQNLKDHVKSSELLIVSNFARPMATNSFTQVANTGILGIGNTASSINISGNSNSLRIFGDSISGFFPYYGEVQIGGVFPGTNHQGIEFSGVPENYSVLEDDAKQSVQMKFQINDRHRGNERYTVFITLFPSHGSSVQIISTYRTSIEYTGTWQIVKEEKKME